MVKYGIRESKGFGGTRGCEPEVARDTVPNSETGSEVFFIVETIGAVMDLMLCWAHEPVLKNRAVADPNVGMPKIRTEKVEGHGEQVDAEYLDLDHSTSEDMKKYR